MPTGNDNAAETPPPAPDKTESAAKPTDADLVPQNLPTHERIDHENDLA